jgi:hypothetical protein
MVSVAGLRHRSVLGTFLERVRHGQGLRKGLVGSGRGSSTFLERAKNV